MPLIGNTPRNSQTPLASPYGTTPQDYADALDQLQRTAPAQIRTGGSLASHLFADALLQYGQDHPPAARQSSPPPAAGAAAPGALPGNVLSPWPQTSFGRLDGSLRDQLKGYLSDPDSAFADPSS